VISISNSFNSLFLANFLRVGQLTIEGEGVQQRIRLAIEESIGNETWDTKGFTWPNNPLARQLPFQHVRFNFERSIAIQHLNCHSKSQ
jgi:hypothetical protein